MAGNGRPGWGDGRTGIVTTALGGTSIHDGGPAAAAFLRGPCGLSVAGNGDIHVADTWNQRVRAIDAETGVIRTVAGEGARAYGGDGGRATEAFLGNPSDVSVGPGGEVLIADTRHSHVRRVDGSGVIHNFAGSGFPWDLGDGGPAINACLISPAAVEHGPRGDAYIADAGAHRIRRVDAETGTITTIAGSGLAGCTGDGGPARQARIGRPESLRFDGAGNLFFVDSAACVVRRVDAASGTIETVLGCGAEGFSADGTPAREARLGSPRGLEVRPDGGTLYVSDTTNGRVRVVGTGGVLRTIAGAPTGAMRGTGVQRPVPGSTTPAACVSTGTACCSSATTGTTSCAPSVWGRFRGYSSSSGYRSSPTADCSRCSSSVSSRRTSACDSSP